MLVGHEGVIVNLITDSPNLVKTVFGFVSVLTLAVVWGSADFVR